ncbi:RNA polymerase subunit sigma-70 [Marinitenerispora sediminis]|uniref:RNA polymerase subunit sigma-70 n=1 Tax=Marinitenerispora sediminis TaxID=1931232 RepID=A0A368T4R9_9ACTN|nr:RNA polymerase subunit sigma-70 [Marinitenerispora sediminis]RCV51403.1 RNA polymerase subunit sigma-70 [Marinitenerispora sediminis]RCV57217.1 RNA polymerase subunit sigma-70 [Marinitenerispora sediminis]RCV58571.1 RNA polymerase subunit sigma-70 [Marinitenerispora sediminis]
MMVGGDPKAVETKPSDWITTVWKSLDERSQDMLIRRGRGQMLEEIGDAYGVTRERARQVIQARERDLAGWADQFQSGWREQVLQRLAAESIVSDAALGEILLDSEGTVRRALLRQLGLKESRTWAGRVEGVWSKTQTSLDELMKRLVSQAPFRADELVERAIAIGIPDTVPVETLVSHWKSPLVRGAGGHWLRRVAKNCDAAYLWLEDVGEARRAEYISEAIEASGPRALSEALRRDDRFRQIRPEGTWALADWPLSQQAGTHTNALDVMVQILRDSGPMTKRELFARVIKEYPVGYARLRQCLISDRLGLTSDGLLGLAEDGAKAMEESEPRQPSSIVVDDSGQVLGIRLPVDKNVWRGSGIIVHPWLTWRLGLRLAPMSRSFDLTDGSGDLVVRRSTSAAQLSSLRSQVQAVGMVEGCDMVVLIRLDTETATVRHACDPDNCSSELGRERP